MILRNPIHINDKFVYVDPSGDAFEMTVTDIHIDVTAECKVSVTFEDLQDAQRTYTVYTLTCFMDRIDDPHTSRVAAESTKAE